MLSAKFVKVLRSRPVLPPSRKGQFKNPTDSEESRD